jgi:hypothetical protein
MHCNCFDGRSVHLVHHSACLQQCAAPRVTSIDVTLCETVLSVWAPALQSNVTSQRVKVLGSVHACEVCFTLTKNLLFLLISLDDVTRQFLLLMMALQQIQTTCVIGAACSMVQPSQAPGMLRTTLLAVQGTVLIVSAFLNAPPTPDPVAVLAAQSAYTPLKVGCVLSLWHPKAASCASCCDILLQIWSRGSVSA